jgi:hypothetical protein
MKHPLRLAGRGSPGGVTPDRVQSPERFRRFIHAQRPSPPNKILNTSRVVDQLREKSPTAEISPRFDKRRFLPAARALVRKPMRVNHLSRKRASIIASFHFAYLGVAHRWSVDCNP